MKPEEWAAFNDQIVKDFKLNGKRCEIHGDDAIISKDVCYSCVNAAQMKKRYPEGIDILEGQAGYGKKI